MENLVFTGQNGQAMTTSLLVAEKFGKEHRNVTRSIRELLQSAQNCAHYFVETEFEDGRGRKQPMYYINRDGFTLLAMGFTGPKALEFKMEFLNAFNTMEAMLKSDDYILARSQEILQNRLEVAKARIQMLEGENKVITEERDRLIPMASYTRDVLQSIDDITFEDCAKELGIRSGHALIKTLLARKVIFKRGDRYLPMADFSDKDYFTTRTHKYFHSDGSIGAKVYTTLTQKGRAYLHSLFNSKGGSPCLQ